MIFYIIYISSTSRLYSDSDLSDILLKSQANNKKNDITGILLYHEGNIMQVLEGDKEAVMKTYDKISQDERHHNVMKMVSRLSDKRNFPDWSMGFKSVTNNQWNDFMGYLNLEPAGIISRLKHSDMNIDTVVKSFLAVNLR